MDVKIPNTRNCQVFSLACGDEIIVKLSELSFYWIYILTKFLFPSLSLTLLSYFSRLKIVKLEFVMINSDTQPRHIWYLTLEGNIPSCNIAVNVKLNLYQYGAKYFSLIFSNILRSVYTLVCWSSAGKGGCWDCSRQLAWNIISVRSVQLNIKYINIEVTRSVCYYYIIIDKARY